MTYTTKNEKWGIEFESDTIKYEGVATRLWSYDNVFFLVNFHKENDPEMVYNGDFSPKKELVDTLIIIKWESKTQGIDPKLVYTIGSAIEKRLKRDNFPLF
jgi:hypothetical protein